MIHVVYTCIHYNIHESLLIIWGAPHCTFRDIFGGITTCWNKRAAMHSRVFSPNISLVTHLKVESLPGPQTSIPGSRRECIGLGVFRGGSSQGLLLWLEKAAWTQQIVWYPTYIYMFVKSGLQRLLRYPIWNWLLTVFLTRRTILGVILSPPLCSSSHGMTNLVTSIAWMRSLATLAMAADAVKVLMIHNAAEVDAGFREALPKVHPNFLAIPVILYVCFEDLFRA